MINPTIDDIGRPVTYRDPSLQRVERGIITSFNIHYVFVRYGAYGTTEAATQREHLEWSPEP